MTAEDKRRAWVTIEFFKLDNIERKNLLRERAMIITALYAALQHVADPKESASDQARWRQFVLSCRSKNAPHTNCADSFCELFSQDPAAAKQIFNLASNLVNSNS